MAFLKLVSITKEKDDELPSGKTKDNSIQSNEAALWRDFKNGDESAFIVIYKKYAGKLLNYGCQIFNDREFIKDCTQDFFIDLIRRRSFLADVNSIKLYLFVSFRRRVLDGIKKKQKNISKLFESAGENFEIELSHETKFINTQLEHSRIQKLNEALKSLSDNEREAIFCYYYEEMSYQDIAKLLNFSHVSSARRLIYKAISQLKQYFPDYQQS